MDSANLFWSWDISNYLPLAIYESQMKNGINKMPKSENLSVNFARLFASKPRKTI